MDEPEAKVCRFDTIDSCINFFNQHTESADQVKQAIGFLNKTVHPAVMDAFRLMEASDLSASYILDAAAYLYLTMATNILCRANNVQEPEAVKQHKEQIAEVAILKVANMANSLGMGKFILEERENDRDNE